MKYRLEPLFVKSYIPLSKVLKEIVKNPINMKYHQYDSLNMSLQQIYKNLILSLEGSKGNVGWESTHESSKQE